MRRSWNALVVAALVAGAGIAPPVAAQVPAVQASRPVTLIVSLAPGGGVDTLARILAEQLQVRMKQGVVVENRPGGGGMIGTDSIARAAPDGNTIGMLESSTVLHKWLHKSVPFDITADFAPIALVAKSALILFTHPSLPATDVTALIALAKASPGALQVGTPGVGTPHHLAALMFNAGAKVEIAPLAYRGTGPALNDLVGGHVKMIWATPVAVMPFLEAGKVKALATASPRRLAAFPDVPAVAEYGLPGFELESWFGVAAPKGTPQAIVDGYREHLREIVGRPDVQARIAQQSFWLDFRDSAAFQAMIVHEHKRLGEVVRALGIGAN